MTRTITIRLTEELDRWLESVSKKSGIPKSEIVRAQLENARADKKRKPFMRLAGSLSLSPELSSRKGYSRK